MAIQLARRTVGPFGQDDTECLWKPQLSCVGGAFDPINLRQALEAVLDVGGPTYEYLVFWYRYLAELRRALLLSQTATLTGERGGGGDVRRSRKGRGTLTRTRGPDRATGVTVGDGRLPAVRLVGRGTQNAVAALDDAVSRRGGWSGPGR